MLRKLIGTLAILVAIAAPAAAQGGFTTVTGTITDPGGVKYSCGTISAQLITAGGAGTPAAPSWKKIVKAVANHVTLDIGVGASSGFATAGGVVCRRNNGPEPCTGHYGAFNQGEVARGVLTFSMIALSEYGRKQGFREWFVPALATGIGNTVWGVREWRTKSKEKN